MHSILTIFLGVYWTVHFTLLASWTVGATSTRGVFGIAGAGLPTATAMGLALAAVLFLWMLVTVIFEPRSLSSQTGKVERFAFSGATAGLTLMLLNGGAQQAGMLMPAVSLQLAALLASYLVVSAERRSSTDRIAADDHAGASLLAAGAAHNAMLSRLSGRAGAAGPV